MKALSARLLFCCLISSAFSALFAQSQAPQPPNESAARVTAWCDDIEYMVRRLEIQHPDLYAQCPRNTFLEAGARLKKRIPTLSDRDAMFGIMELHDSLGRAEEARKCCQQCLRLNPGHRLAKARMEMMELQLPTRR